MEDKPVKIKDKLYYARVHHNTGTYDVCDLIVQSTRDAYFAATDKRDKHRYLFSYNDINKLIFFDREDALKIVLEAQANRPQKYQYEEE